MSRIVFKMFFNRFRIFFLYIYLFSYSIHPKDISDLPIPKDYTRVIYPTSSFSYYLQHLPLKPEKNIYTFRGNDVSIWYQSMGVINKPLLFKEDLEQCADFTMRLWADYHKDNNILKDLYLFNYSGKKIYFKNQNSSYSNYLRKTFVSSNSYSLKTGCKNISKNDLRPGDLFVQNENGGIGHVSIILDHARLEKSDIYLIGFSFMPAQEMHIESAPANRGIDGWFRADGFTKHLKENYPYGIPVLRRF